MNRSSSRGIKLTTVILAVIILAVSAVLTTGSTLDDKDVTIEQKNSELSN